ncbi:MAG: precorrin-6y C5,15-methyltransferase (decarboxylating) subunit CbiE [Rhizobiaceae bacterium]
MVENPWLTIVGLGEDGPDGLAPASQKAIDSAEVVIGPERHLSLLVDCNAECIAWPIPFVDGIPKLLDHRGRNVVVLVSGDPFWFGAGSVLARELESDEWRALPAPSTFSLAAAKLGWPIENTIQLGLHAAPYSRLRPHLGKSVKAVVTVRDGDAVSELASWLNKCGFGETVLSVMESLGGPTERVRKNTAKDFNLSDVRHPVIVGLDVAGNGVRICQSGGLEDGLFDHDGQITKRPIRALTLSALAPKPGEILWDLGAGSGSIAIEWLLSSPTTTAIAVEMNEERAKRIRSNADSLGVDRLEVIEGQLPEIVHELENPDVVFIGGGLSAELVEVIWQKLQPGTRVVANAVTLESESELAKAQEKYGGELMRIELAESNPLGSKRGWKSSYPIVQWSVIR